MKFRKFGRIALALVVSLGTGLGVTSCSTDHTVGYFYVTGSQYNQISAFKIDSNLGQLTPIPNSPFASSGSTPSKRWWPMQEDFFMFSTPAAADLAGCLSA